MNIDERTNGKITTRAMRRRRCMAFFSLLLYPAYEIRLRRRAIPSVQIFSGLRTTISLTLGLREGNGYSYLYDLALGKTCCWGGACLCERRVRAVCAGCCRCDVGATKCLPAKNK